MFRIRPGRAGTLIGAPFPSGTLVVELHLWNDRVPRIPQGGPGLAWARRMARATVEGLRAVAREIERDPRLAGARAVVATAVVVSPWRGEGARRLLARLGFRVRRRARRRGRIAAAAERLWAAALVRAFQPAGALPRFLIRLPVADLWIPMDEFLARYGRGTPLASDA
jgi:hypothetical protein